MLKQLVLTFALMPVAAQAFSQCDLTDLGGPGAEIVEEGSNPVVSGQWAYAGFTQDHKVMILAASNNGATQQPLQTIFDNERGKSVNLRLAATGKYVYAVWHFGPRGTTQLMFAVNHDHGRSKTWSKPVALDVVHRALAQISVDGNNVHIAYVSPKNDTMAISSADNGQTFGTPVDLGAGDGEVVVASRGADVYAAWETGKTSPLPAVDFGYSHDGGKTFSVSNISNNGVRHAHEPIMSLNQKSGRLSMVWREDTPTQGSYLQSNDAGVNLEHTDRDRWGSRASSWCRTMDPRSSSRISRNTRSMRTRTGRSSSPSARTMAPHSRSFRT